MLDLRNVLDPANDDHWDDTGRPRISVVRKLTGVEQATRADIDKTGVRRPKISAKPEPMVSEVKPLEIFDAKGRPRVNYTDGEIAAIPEGPQREAFSDLFAASIAEHEAEANLATATGAIHTTAVASLKAHEGLIIAQSTNTNEARAQESAEDRRIREARRSSRATSADVRELSERERERERGEADQDAKREAAIRRAVNVHRAAEEEARQARVNLQAAQLDLRNARQNIAEALAAWQAFAAPITRDSLQRAVIAKSQQRLLEVKRGVYVDPRPVNRPQSDLDVAMASKARGHSTRRA